jgi:pimeloyl-ACP methyl ester carboxylesterase
LGAGRWFPERLFAACLLIAALHLIWGSADQTFPLSVARELQRVAQQLGGPVTLDVYEGGAHDFFLRKGSRSTGAAHKSAADFLASYLLR